MRVKSLRHFHRITGLCVLLPMVLLVATGIPLQYSDALRLGQIGVSWHWVHRAYGLSAPTSAITSAAVTQIGDRLFVGERAIARDERMVGAISNGDLSVIALDGTLLIVPNDPAIPFEAMSLPTRAVRFGGDIQDALFIDSNDGVLTSRDLGVQWRETRATPTGWTSVRPADDLAEWKARFNAANLTWERWLVDLHSGRFFGPIGEIVMSLASIALSLLGITGLVVWLYLRRR
jgi:uncharacterized iron-regulated membrane protein